MSRRRYISTDISTDGEVNRLVNEHGYLAGILFTWMIAHAEEDCSITADPFELRTKVIPGIEKARTADVTRALKAMLDLGLVEQCLDTRRIRFKPETFYRWQSYIKTERQLPAPAARDAAQHRTTPQGTADLRPTPPNAACREGADNTAQGDINNEVGAKNAALAPHNTAQHRRTEKKVASVSVSVSDSVSVSSSVSDSVSVSVSAAAAVRRLNDLLCSYESYRPDDEYNAIIARRYGTLDLELEGVKFLEWLRSNPGGRCTTKAVLTWLEKAAEEAKGRKDRARGNGKPARPRGGRRSLADASKFAALYDQVNSAEEPESGSE